MADGRERTDAEREAARLERERRRAERLGQAPRSERLEQEPGSERAPAVPDRAPPPEPAPPPVPPADTGAGPVAGREPEHEPRVAHPFGFDDGWEEADGGEYQEEWERGHVHEDGELEGWGDTDRPSGTRRVTALQRLSDAPERDRVRVSRPKPPRAARRSPWRRRIGSLIALALAGAVIWFLVELFQPFHGAGHGRIRVVIPPHASSSQIGDELERDGVIASSFFFKLRATLAGDRGDLRAGTYTLQHDMSYSRVLTVLTTAPKAAPTSLLTLVPGRTRVQINRLLRAQGIRGSYLAASRHSPLLNPRAYGAPRSTPDLEGFLFPDTYQLRDPVTASALVADQLKNFRRQFATVGLGYARRRHLTPYDVLIIASMVEDESATAHDRPLVASVIYNRLARGMPLQIDATTRYATGNYTKPLTQSQLNSPSPYNTRIHPGLTPTPIDNPGLAAIQAAAHPARTNYLYFVVKPCGNGEQTFTASYQQFLRDSARYQQARSQRGGRSPEHC